MVISTWFDAYRHHFLTTLGTPSFDRVYDGEQIDYPFAMMVYRARNGLVFCTCGLSMYSGRIGEVLEICCPLLGTELLDAERILVAMILDVLHTPGQIHPGMAIDGIDAEFPEFYSKHAKSSIYISDLQPDYEMLDLDVIHNGGTGRVYQETFITSEESRFLIDHGQDAFEDLLAEKNVVSDDLDRPSAL